MKGNWFEIVIGVVVFCYGLYTIYLRMKKPEKLNKIAALRRFWGNRLGTIIHVVFYTIIPILFGVVLITSGFAGKNIF